MRSAQEKAEAQALGQQTAKFAKETARWVQLHENFSKSLRDM